MRSMSYGDGELEMQRLEASELRFFQCLRLRMDKDEEKFWRYIDVRLSPMIHEGS